MLWALLAAFLRRRPPWLQAGTVGLCTGIFIVANVNAGQRDLRLGPAAALVLAAPPYRSAGPSPARSVQSCGAVQPAGGPRPGSMLHTPPCG